MKLSSGLFVLLENAHAAVAPGPRTNDDTAYGDMVFSGCQYERMLKDPRLPSGLHFNHDGSACSSPLERTFPPWRGYQDDADGKFIVPYFFDFGYNNTEYDGFLGEHSASAIRWKLGEMNKKLNVKFVEIYQDEVDLYPDHIEIVNEENDDFLSACASYIGKIGGKQKWYMRPDCAFHDYSQVNHFAMYILGFGPAFTRSGYDFAGAGYHEISNEDIDKINGYYPLDEDNLCLNGLNKCPAEASCRPIPHYDKYICDCPAGTITSMDSYDMYNDQKCVVPDHLYLFEWTNTTHFHGYELRAAPYLEFRDANGSYIWDYDHKQEIYARANLISFGPSDAPVSPEFWPEIQDNVVKFDYGSTGFYDMVVPEPGYYQFAYEIVDGQGNKFFPEFDTEGETYDVTQLAPVAVTMDNIPEILPNNVTHEVSMQMINELGEPVFLGPQLYHWMDFEWDLWIEYQNPDANWTWKSYIDGSSCDENGAITFKMNLIDYADAPGRSRRNAKTFPLGASTSSRREERKAIAQYGDKIWPRYVTPGPVRLFFANWGFNEMIKDLPIEETKFHYSEWFIFASANCTDCHEHAQCNDEGMCECNEGFSGDGYSYCIPKIPEILKDHLSAISRRNSVTTWTFQSLNGKDEEECDTFTNLKQALLWP
ncbi:Oidioi.mRNA.OKI2018_I69.chr2.g4159.t1.cds [Oikopleura dioica]|uniref:Oidioi.mRNA.OKI2018_I69.chr2.g4159.t1.cds n=1 Tax=Oikopleura dioica TaxID=34765 RepID=A0ABN7SWE8_OIKDI|nr:Oidioi.mRNA.OKI2018_I69.chr2.g4159.t1.cds [Oikopleura dioica]